MEQTSDFSSDSDETLRDISKWIKSIRKDVTVESQQNKTQQNLGAYLARYAELATVCLVPKIDFFHHINLVTRPGSGFVDRGVDKLPLEVY